MTALTACARKRRHDTLTQALEHIAALYRARKDTLARLHRLRAYSCGCGGWHVGHGPEKGPANPTPSQAITP